MRLTLTDPLVGRVCQDGSAIPFALKCYTDSSEPWALTVPTSIRYRVENPETRCEIVAWTSVSAASSATITVTGAQNTISCGDERRRLVVEADHGLSTATVATRDWTVRDIAGVSA